MSNKKRLKITLFCTFDDEYSCIKDKYNQYLGLKKTTSDCLTSIVLDLLSKGGFEINETL